jgi:hypothetical protein
LPFDNYFLSDGSRSGNLLTFFFGLDLHFSFNFDQKSFKKVANTDVGKQIGISIQPKIVRKIIGTTVITATTPLPIGFECSFSA